MKKEIKIFSEEELKTIIDWSLKNGKEGKNGLITSTYGTVLPEGTGFIPKPQFFTLLREKGFDAIDIRIIKTSFKGVMILTKSEDLPEI